VARYNPCNPCCAYLSIVTGIYCYRLLCSGPFVGGVAPVTAKKYYFPAQTIKLTRLGYGKNYLDFHRDEKEIATRSWSTEKELDATPDVFLPEFKFLASKYVDADGNLNIAKIEAERDSSLKGWPPSFFFTNKDIRDYTWYRLDYDMGKYGKYYDIFRTDKGDFVQQRYKALGFQTFIPQPDPADPPGTKGAPQDNNYLCCTPCLVKKSDFNITIAYAGGDLATKESDWIYRYYGQFLDVDPVTGAITLVHYHTDYPYYHQVISYSDVNLNLNFVAKWDDSRQSWVSDHKLVFTRTTTRAYTPMFCDNSKPACPELCGHAPGCTDTYVQKFYQGAGVSCSVESTSNAFSYCFSDIDSAMVQALVLGGSPLNDIPPPIPPCKDVFSTGFGNNGLPGDSGLYSSETVNICKLVSPRFDLSDLSLLCLSGCDCQTYGLAGGTLVSGSASPITCDPYSRTASVTFSPDPSNSRESCMPTVTVTTTMSNT
jgi:hypothetical protein